MRWKDGTLYNPPKNPLKDKWGKLYPPCDLSNHGDFDYSCILCDKCPNSEYWDIPEEDKEVYEHYRTDYRKYIEEHGGLENLILEQGIDFNWNCMNCEDPVDDR